MKKIILFLILFILVYLKPKIPSEIKCQIRYMYRKVKLSFNELSSIKNKGLIPFSLELKNEISNQEVNAYCYIEKSLSKNSERNTYCYILSDLLDDTSSYIISKINSEFKLDPKNKVKFNFNQCEYSRNNKQIFFRQVNNFTVTDDKGYFMFYAITKNYSLPSITFLTNIIYKNKSEIREANCFLKQENKTPTITQIAYKCEIEEIEIKDFKYLMILDSDDISGIPYEYNNILRNPIETQKAIQEGILVNCAESSQLKNIKIFNIKKTQCMKNRGILRFNGNINSEINERKNLTVFLSYLHKQPSGCIIPTSDSGKEVNMECILFNDISEKNIFMFEEQILTIGKDDILFNYESNSDEIECEAMNLNLNITFKDRSPFKLEKNKIKFNFIGSTTQTIEVNYNLILYLDLIYKDTKEKKLSTATCMNKGLAIPNNQNPVETNYTCEVIVENEKKYSSIELNPYNYFIHSASKFELPNNNIINDALFKFNSDIISFSNCPKLKEFTINGTFDGIINDTINFEMKGAFQLQYTSNCTLYKNSEGKAEIHCVINNNFLSTFEQHVLNDQFSISDIDLKKEIKCGNNTNQSKDDIEDENREKTIERSEKEEEIGDKYLEKSEEEEEGIERYEEEKYEEKDIEKYEEEENKKRVIKEYKEEEFGENEIKRNEEEIEEYKKKRTDEDNEEKEEEIGKNEEKKEEEIGKNEEEKEEQIEKNEEKKEKEIGKNEEEKEEIEKYKEEEKEIERNEEEKEEKEKYKEEEEEIERNEEEKEEIEKYKEEEEEIERNEEEKEKEEIEKYEEKEEQIGKNEEKEEEEIEKYEEEKKEEIEKYKEKEEEIERNEEKVKEEIKKYEEEKEK